MRIPGIQIGVFSQIGGIVFTTVSVSAQIIPDNTLPVNSVVAPNCIVCTINGGTVRGHDLFHSFQEFSIPIGGTAFFNNNLGIQNILMRVTGHSVSNIDGLIRANGTTNLFLLNPNGITFGANARLQIGGSFFATTADRFQFSDGSEFSATNPQAPPLLTVNLPMGLQYGQPVGDLTQVGPLEVLPGQMISLHGRNITASGLNAGTILLNASGNINVSNSLSNQGGTKLQAGKNIEATNIVTSREDIEFVASGTIRATNISLAPNLGNAFAGSQITMQAKGDIVASQVSASNAIGNTGDVLLTSSSGDIYATHIKTSAGFSTGNITLTANAGKITASNLVSNGGVDTGNIRLMAVGDIISSEINTASRADKSGDIRLTSHMGSIDTTAGNLISLTLGAQSGSIALWAAQDIRSGPLIASSTSGSGEIAITAGGNFSVSNSLISTDASKDGRSGDVIVTARSVSLLDGAQISTSGSGTAQSGNVLIQTTDTLLVQGTSPDNQPPRGVYASTDNSIGVLGGQQLGGFVPTETLSQQLGNAPSGIFTATKGSGHAGQVSITADQVVVQKRGAIAATTFASGSAGAITITAKTFTASEGGQLLTSTSGSGSAGDIMTTVSGTFTLDGSNTGFIASTNPGSTGHGGSVTVNVANAVEIRNGAGIAVGSQGTGQGGDLVLYGQQITLSDRAFLTAETATSQGGNITIGSQGLLMLRRNSLISASAGTSRAGGDGGNITINVPDSFVIGVLSENSDIRANAFTGNGGQVSITTLGIYGLEFQSQDTPSSDITASSRFGSSGTVTLNTLNVDPNRGLVALASSLVDSSNQISSECSSAGHVEKQSNTFVFTGRGGVPESPEAGVSGDRALVSLTELVDSPARNSNPEITISSPPEAIIEAQGWMTGTNGSIYLVANAANLIPHSSWQNPTKCLDSETTIGLIEGNQESVQ